MLYLDDVSLPGNGTISGAFWSQDRRILAVTSVFRLLTEPPARAAYGGRKLSYRVALYRPPSRRPIAVFDGASLPINDVAFHPTKTVVALGAGSYDGGYLFEGQLLLWDWSESRSQSLRAIPEIKRLRFVDDRDAIEAIVRPWDEQQVADPFDTFYRLSLDEPLTRPWGSLAEQVVRDQIDSQTPLAGPEVAALSDFGQPAESPHGEIERAFALDGFLQRSPIWDLALLGSDAIGIVHDDCLLEIFDRQGEQRHSFKGRGHGAQIFRAHEPLIHVAHFDKDAADWRSAWSAALMRLQKDRLQEVASFTGRYTFSMAQNGSLLGRRDRSFQEKREGAEVDLIVSPDLEEMTCHDFGHYDAFNHYIRVDAAPCLFLVQGTPPGSHQAKYLCTVTTGGVERLWPLLADNGDQASHAMECCFCYIDDHRGPGLIVSGKHYNSSPGTPYSGFIFRRNLDGRELWRHATKASAPSIKFVSSSGLVLAAFLDGSLAVLRGDVGAIMRWQEFKPEGVTSTIISMDLDDTHVAFGTIDGRCGVMPLSDLTAADPPSFRG